MRRFWGSGGRGFVGRGGSLMKKVLHLGLLEVLERVVNRGRSMMLGRVILSLRRRLVYLHLHHHQQHQYRRNHTHQKRPCMNCNHSSNSSNLRHLRHLPCLNTNPKPWHPLQQRQTKTTPG